MPALLQEYATACFAEGWAMRPLEEIDIRQLFAKEDSINMFLLFG
jgi:hypothetical protein